MSDDDLDDAIERHLDRQEPTGPEVECPCAYGRPEECDLDHESASVPATETEKFGRAPDADAEPGREGEQ